MHIQNNQINPDAKPAFYFSPPKNIFIFSIPTFMFYDLQINKRNFIRRKQTLWIQLVFSGSPERRLFFLFQQSSISVDSTSARMQRTVYDAYKTQQRRKMCARVCVYRIMTARQAPRVF